MRRRWYYLKRTIRANRPILFLTALLLLAIAFLIGKLDVTGGRIWELFRTYGVSAAESVLKDWFPAISEDGDRKSRAGIRTILFSYLGELGKSPEYSEDPAYERLMAEKRKESHDTAGETGALESTDHGAGTDPDADNRMEPAGEVIAMKPVSPGVIREKLADFDYMMQNFYSVHPTTTAGRDLMNAEKFLSMDLSMEKDGENPQILIYHTHSREEFSDYPENPEAMITGVGAYLAELMEEKGYCVIHDTSVYDFRDGKLDRSKAYTYALDGISGILQKYPSVQVVLDIHRDGVSEGTRLVKEINGKPTAQIMFFNGISQTPDGPIEYLPNPNREANLAFSFQMQLKAAEEYPGFTRKIYLKGLRYNQHVRARAALIEVGAQTNTYEEARNAMEPLADILDKMLGGSQTSVNLFFPTAEEIDQGG